MRCLSKFSKFRGRDPTLTFLSRIRLPHSDQSYNCFDDKCLNNILKSNLNHHHHITKKPDFSQAYSQKRLISRQASENQHSPSSPPSMMPAQLQRQKSDIFNRQTIEEPREVLVRSMSAPHSFTCLKAKSLKICDNIPQITGRNQFSSIGKADFLTMMFDDKCSALSESEFPPQILRLLSEEEVKDIVDTY